MALLVMFVVGVVVVFVVVSFSGCVVVVDVARKNAHC